jgi:hypothetical protein
VKTFKLNCHVTVSAFTEVQAETLEEAIKIANSRDVVLGGPGSGTYPDESWVIEYADGEPTNIHPDED